MSGFGVKERRLAFQRVKAQWLIKVRRDNFSPTKNTRVCSRHFRPGDLLVTAGGLHRVQKGATPVLFAWNNYELPTPRRNVWERRPRAESPTPDMTAENEVETVAPPDHDYCLNPATAVMANQVADENEALKIQIRELQLQLEVLQCGNTAISFRDTTPGRVGRGHSFLHKHFLAIWKLVEPAANTKMVRITNTKASSASSSDSSQPTTTKLPPIDELLLFLMLLSVGLHLRDIAERFGIHRTTVSRIISTWTLFLYQLLGSKRLWIPRKVVRAQLPPDLPACLSVKKKKMSREDVRQTQSIARLRVHVERCIRRVKENKLFDKAIPLCGSIEELFNVAWFLVNYQNGPLVKAWASLGNND
ncbi:hypothetical protein F7725_007743 [Dissostichus mawsoni]|uniref:THAP-type domain-containing protein n=1 Tax=Dissostichus mawsoni TaxID=36200 RepID=A0A7J5Y5B8_DISMA|nr:hypothetical protein F7725_007743 [Dissostichus mawsoni]